MRADVARAGCGHAAAWDGRARWARCVRLTTRGGRAGERTHRDRRSVFPRLWDFLIEKALRLCQITETSIQGSFANTCATTICSSSHRTNRAIIKTFEEKLYFLDERVIEILIYLVPHFLALSQPRDIRIQHHSP
jgi:hypothetical protein